MVINGEEIFNSIRENPGAYFVSESWYHVGFMPSLKSSFEVFEWLGENNICFIMVSGNSRGREPGFCFWEEEDAVAFKLKWL